MNMQDWVTRWALPQQALDELAAVLYPSGQVAPVRGEGETATMAAVRVEASMRGVTLWRNNVGVLKNEDGRPVRYGLGNESKQVNEVFKSSDLIGIRPRLIVAADVGRTLGQFVAREVKEPKWAGPRESNAREQAQLAFLQFIIAKGGDAAFCNGTGTL